MTGARARPLAELVRAVTEIPAPPFGEAARAAWVRARLAARGLAPWEDEAGNVLVELPGGTGERMALCAHLDTVFPAGTDTTVRERDGRLFAPGIVDDGAGVALLLELAMACAQGEAGPRPPVLAAFTVGEEGAGDLRGARRLVRDHAGALAAFVALDGHLGAVIDTAVGSRRYRVTFRGEGGHAWADYPSPSAVHALGDAVHALHRLRPPDGSRGSLNVGEVAGGSSVNAIAEEAWLTLDLRSLEPEALQRMTAAAERRVRNVARRHRVRVETTVLGERPAGRSDDGRLRDAARDALRAEGIAAQVAAASTDAGAATEAGLPALCLGLARGGDAHRLAEWLDPASLEEGARVLRAFLARLVAAPAAGA